MLDSHQLWGLGFSFDGYTLISHPKAIGYKWCNNKTAMPNEYVTSHHITSPAQKLLCQARKHTLSLQLDAMMVTWSFLLFHIIYLAPFPGDSCKDGRSSSGASKLELLIITVHHCKFAVFIGFYAQAGVRATVRIKLTFASTCGLTCQSIIPH
ncbi:hypothetical protein BS47DRAFT_557807 [Hydnum rufescens UP504]|uniref:Uncharacterized protein n=1 Tax=Hydnum rufescens UP504 TaxID=1448309 RepID=A0A9P6AHD9_9AGAM|nr:hypothetical protein BS47DRAFT_557807 [Hydnum rufescens UP504]